MNAITLSISAGETTTIITPAFAIGDTVYEVTDKLKIRAWKVTDYTIVKELGPAEYSIAYNLSNGRKTILINSWFENHSLFSDYSQALTKLNDRKTEKKSR